MGRRDDIYGPALAGKKIPILTLDHKWHSLFTQYEPTPEITELAEELNELLKRQGRLNSDMKKIKALKKKLMEEIVTLRNGEQQTSDVLESKVEENKRLIEESNEKLEACQDELIELPARINAVNYQLMLQTMETCYERIQNGTSEIQEISEWVAQIRVELKKKLIRKQEKEQMNFELYSYMHDIFGADVIDIFDLKYNPEENRPKPPLKSEKNAE